MTALPARWAFASYFVTGRVDRDRQPVGIGGHPAQERLGVADLGDLLGVPGVIGGGVQHPTAV